MIEVFPVIPKPNAPEEKNLRGKPCRTKGYWFTDTHTARRGRGRHHAQDIFAATGSLVVAPEVGMILGSSRDTGPTTKGGHWIRLGAGPSLIDISRTYYMSHLHNTPLVGVDDKVIPGQPIGQVGRTGNAMRTCPHLHIRAAHGEDRLLSNGQWRRARGGTAINIYQELKDAPLSINQRHRCTCCGGLLR